MVKKTIAMLLIIILCLFTLSGCYNAEGLETLAYAVAIGIDKGENNQIKLTLQFALSNDSNSSGSSSQSQKSTITAVECATIDSGIALINSYISKKVNLSHCKAIIISEDIAYEGVSEYIYTFVNNLEIRPDCNIIISRCNAYDYLNNSEPTLESVSARYYEFILNSSEYTGYTQNIKLSDFYSNMLSTTSQAYAILGGINDNATHKTHSDSPNYDIEGSYKADETPIDTETGVENMGIAVFKNDILVGELNGMEALSHLLVINEFENATISAPNPYNKNSSLSLYINSNKSPKIDVKIINGTPYITCNFYISGYILSLDENMNYSDENTMKLINESTNLFLEQNISSYLYKTAKDYKSDIGNFGKHVISNYITWNDWIESDWLFNYQNSFFNVNVETSIENGQLYTRI